MINLSSRVVARGLAILAVSAFSLTSLTAGDSTPEPAPENSFLSDWWNGKYMTGNWFGLRDTLEDNGLKFYGKYYGAFFGVVDSQGGSRGFWDQGLEFGGELNAGKLFKVEELEGVK